MVVVVRGRDLEGMLQELQRLKPFSSYNEPAVGATPIVIASRPGASLETPRVSDAVWAVPARIGPYLLHFLLVLLHR